MAPAELFSLYAELSVALAGFAGVTSAFAGRDRVFEPTELIRFLAVIVAAAFILVGCFTFFAARAAGFDEATSLRLVGFGPAVSMSISLLTLYRRAVRASREPGSSSEPWALGVTLTTYLISIALFVAATFPGPSYASVVTAFSLIFLHGLWMFVRLLTRRN